MYERENFLSATATVYALLSVLAGIGMLAVGVLLIAAFGAGSTDLRFFLVFLVPAALFVGLAGPIRRQKLWAMAVVLMMTAALCVIIGLDASLVSWVTLFGAIVFALLTGIHLGWGGPFRR